MLRRSAFVSALALLVLPATGMASGWTSPAAIDGTAGRTPLIASPTPTGYALAVKGPLAMFPGTPQVPLAWSTTSTPSGAFGAPATLPHGLSAPLAISPGGTALAVGGPRSPLDYFALEGRSAKVRIGIGRAGAPLRLVRTRGLRASLTLAAAIDDRGDAAAVFSHCITKGCSKRMLFAAFRRRGGGFGSPLVLARRTGVPAGAVTLNARGDAMLAWTQQRADGGGYLIRVRTRRADGSLTPVRTAGTVRPRPTLTVTLSSGRRGNVSWFSEPVAEGGDGGPYVVRTRLLDSRGTLHGLRTLDQGTPSGHNDMDAIPGPRLLAVPDGRGTLIAWTGFANGRFVVRGSHVVDDVATDLVLAPENVDARLQGLAIDAAGDAIVGWVTAPEYALGAAGATLRTGLAGTFGAPVPLIPEAATAAVAVAPGPRALLAAGGAEAGNSKAPVSTVQYTP
jgi:hypothetical protein